MIYAAVMQSLTTGCSRSISLYLTIYYNQEEKQRGRQLVIVLQDQRNHNIRFLVRHARTLTKQSVLVLITFLESELSLSESENAK